MYPYWNYFIGNEYQIEILKDGELYADNYDTSLSKDSAKRFLVEITSVISIEEDKVSSIKFIDMLKNLLNDLELMNSQKMI
jgi:hypothetical protein